MYVAYSNLNQPSRVTLQSSFDKQSSMNPKSKTLFRFLVVLVLFVFVFSFVALMKVNANNTVAVSEGKQPVQVIVQRGHTLWGIASENLPKGKSVRSYIAQIKKHNQLKSSYIQEGDVLLLP